jgi:hypothetical protein
MGIQIQMFGIEQVKNMLVELPQDIEKGVDKAEGTFMSFVQKSAKLRAPRFSGQLAESISKSKIKMGNWELIVESPYGFFEEYGWSPRFLPASLYSRAGYLIGDWMSAKGKEGFGIKPRGIPHPFITPALEAGIVKLPSMLQEEVYTAIKKSAKGGAK